jgi:hypothetical protein
LFKNPDPLLTVPDKVATLPAPRDKTTGNPDVEEASTGTLLSPLIGVLAAKGDKVMTWLALAISKLPVAVPL